MGTYYQFAMIHDALHVWWTDSNGVKRVMVLTTSEATDFADWADRQNSRIQAAVAQMVREHPEAVR